MAGDAGEALTQVDEAIAVDPHFAAAHAFRQEIVSKMQARAAVETETRGPVRQARQVPRRPRRARRWLVRAATAPAIAAFAIGAIAAAISFGASCGDCDAAATSPLRLTTAPVLPATPVPRLDAMPVFLARPSAAAAESDASLEWMSSRLAQLGVRPRWRAAALDVDDPALLRDLAEALSELWVGTMTANADAIFVGDRVPDDAWSALHSSLKRTGVVWRISARGAVAGDARDAATAAGFVRLRRVRYSPDFIAEQFAPRSRRP